MCVEEFQGHSFTTHFIRLAYRTKNQRNASARRLHVSENDGAGDEQRAPAQASGRLALAQPRPAPARPGPGNTSVRTPPHSLA